eukprot:SAG22_NODE_19118_length_278_cov_0.575419_1_plen_44_part_01
MTHDDGSKPCLLMLYRLTLRSGVPCNFSSTCTLRHPVGFLGPED